MFLFKRKKDGLQEKTVLDKTESIIKLAKENKEKTKQQTGSNSTDKKNQGKHEQSGKILNTVQESDSQMKVVIPASSLVEDQEVISLKNFEIDETIVSEEDVDKLLVQVNKDKPTVEVPDISLDILTSPKEAAEKPKPAMSQPEVKLGSGLDAKTESKPEMKLEQKPSAQSETKPGAPVGDKDKKDEGADKGNLFSNLFGKVEVEEDDPLKKLIKTLPEITMDEVMIEAEEVKGLISEWYVPGKA
jgi:hypothetical protein